jgi:hypothetical protein
LPMLCLLLPPLSANALNGGPTATPAAIGSAVFVWPLTMQ